MSTIRVCQEITNRDSHADYFRAHPLKQPYDELLVKWFNEFIQKWQIKNLPIPDYMIFGKLNQHKKTARTITWRGGQMEYSGDKKFVGIVISSEYFFGNGEEVAHQIFQHEMAHYFCLKCGYDDSEGSADFNYYLGWFHAQRNPPPPKFNFGDSEELLG